MARQANHNGKRFPVFEVYPASENWKKNTAEIMSH
jgi:hypothetical protein